MSQANSATKTAVISISKALLGVSFTTIAALGGLTGVGWITLTSAVPGAALGAFGNLEPLLQKVKGTKEETIAIAMPGWWSKRNDNSWQEICSNIEGKLPGVINRTVDRLKKETRIPTTTTILSIFTEEIEHSVSTWESNVNERGLIAIAVAEPFLAKVARLFREEIEILQHDAMAQKIEEIAEAVAVLAAAAQTPQTPATTGTPPSLQGSHSHIDVLREKMQKGEYDVYICYHKDDIEAIKEIDKKLKDEGILPWFDMRSQAPGISTLTQEDERIKKVEAGAVFIGKAAPDREQTAQIEALIHEFVKREFVRVIPVYLPDAPTNPELSVFLENFAGVDFRQSDPDPFAYLLWGITGQRPSML